MNLYHLSIPIFLQDQDNQESAKALTLTVQAQTETAALSLVSGALQQMIYFSANGVKDLGAPKNTLQAEVKYLTDANKLLSERCTTLEQAAGKVLRGGPLSGLEKALRGEAAGTVAHPVDALAVAEKTIEELRARVAKLEA